VRNSFLVSFFLLSLAIAIALWLTSASSFREQDAGQQGHHLDENGGRESASVGPIQDAGAGRASEVVDEEAIGSC
jgi:hypothetical protein